MRSKKIPVLLGILLLIVGAVVGVMYLGQGTDFLPRAAPEYIPREVKLTNVGANGFTVSWVTREPTIGFVQYGTDPDDLTETAVDERDQLSGSNGSYRSHYVSLQQLDPLTTYYYKLGSQANQLYDNDGTAFNTTTGPALESDPDPDAAYGVVVTPAQTPAAGTIVYLMLPQGTPLSGLVQQDGNWTIDMAQSRTQSLQNYLTYDPVNDPVTLLMRADETQTAQVTALTQSLRPLQQVVLGDVVDIRRDDSQAPAAIEESKFSISEFVVTEPGDVGDIVVATLPRDDMVLDSDSLIFEGTAPLGASLTVSVHGPVILTSTASVANDGTWTWEPREHMMPGSYVFSANYTDDSDMFHSVTRSFQLGAAAEGSPQYSATPSATLAPSPTARPTAKPSVVPTVTPSPTLGDTLAPTRIPASPTQAVRVSYPATSSGTPVAGFVWPTLLMVMVGGGLLFLGFSLSRT